MKGEKPEVRGGKQRAASANGRASGAAPTATVPRLVSYLADARQPSFLLPFLLFAFLLLLLPNCRPNFGDEISALEMTRGGVGETLGAVATDVHPPLYFLLLKAVRTVTGERAWALRLLSVAFALAAFVLFWAVARRFFGRSVAVPAWLLASSSFLVFGARFIRYYSLGLLETAAATYLLFQLLERPTRRLWIAYGAVTVLSLYTFYLALITMAAHAVVFLVAWRREPQRFLPPLLVAIIAIVVFIPWVGIFGRQAGRIAVAQTPIGFGANLRLAAAQIAYTFYAFVASDSISPFALPFSVAVAVFYGLLTLLGLHRIRQAKTARRHVLPAMVGLGLLVPAAMRLAGLLPVPFIYVPVRLLFVAPFFLFILACGILAIGDRRIRGLAFATALAIQAVSLFNYYTLRQWTNWAYVVPGPEIIAHVAENARPEDLVIFDEWNLGRGPFFYWDGEAAVYRFGPAATRLPSRVDSARRIWVVHAMRDNSPLGQMDELLLHIKRNFFLIARIPYVKEPPALYAQKRRWVKRGVYPYKIETLLFERPSGGEGEREKLKVRDGGLAVLSILS